METKMVSGDKGEWLSAVSKKTERMTRMTTMTMATEMARSTQPVKQMSTMTMVMIEATGRDCTFIITIAIDLQCKTANIGSFLFKSELTFGGKQLFMFVLKFVSVKSMKYMKMKKMKKKTRPK